MGIIEEGERWLWTVAVRKVVVAIVGFVTSQAAIALLTKFGVAVDSQKLQIELTAFLIGAFSAIHDWVKLRTGWTWL